MTRPIRDEITVVCYDIADDRRRYRVARTLEGYGTRAQESVFECWLAPMQRRELRARLDRIVAAEDRVAFYALSAQDENDIVLLGRDAQLAENTSAVVV